MTIKNASGVYRIVNTENGKRYYGSSNNLRKRWNNHKSDMRKGEHENPGIREDVATFGEEVFEFEPLVYCPESEMKELEARFINKRIHSVRCYNRRDGNGSCEHTEETKAKISAANMGENHPMYGKTHTDESKAKISAAGKGKPKSEEHKAKISAAQKGKPKAKATCPHCGLTGGGNVMKRWHFENCSHRQDQ